MLNKIPLLATLLILSDCLLQKENPETKISEQNTTMMSQSYQKHFQIKSF